MYFDLGLSSPQQRLPGSPDSDGLWVPVVKPIIGFYSNSTLWNSIWCRDIHPPPTNPVLLLNGTARFWNNWRRLKYNNNHNQTYITESKTLIEAWSLKLTFQFWIPQKNHIFQVWRDGNDSRSYKGLFYPTKASRDNWNDPFDTSVGVKGQ